MREVSQLFWLLGIIFYYQCYKKQKQKFKTTGEVAMLTKDIKQLIKNNKNTIAILSLGVITILLVEIMGKGEVVVNIICLLLHVVGDLFTALSLKRYSFGAKKSGTIYQILSFFLFLCVASIGLVQTGGKSGWQYLLGCGPFLIANAYQVGDAWKFRWKKYFNWQTTAASTVVLALGYMFFHILPNTYAWVFIAGYSALPILLGMEDSPEIYLGRVSAVGVMNVGVLIDLVYQFFNSSIIPSNIISTFFISFIALLLFLENAEKKVKESGEKGITKEILTVLARIHRAINWWESPKTQSPTKGLCLYI